MALKPVIKNQMGVCRLCKTKTNKLVLSLGGFPRAAQEFYCTAEEAIQTNSIELLIGQCEVCSLVQLQNEPVEYYKDVITAASLSEKSKTVLIDEWRPFVAQYGLDGERVLEVGAGRGDFLYVLKRLGLVPHGLENSAENSEVCKLSGAKVFTDYLLNWQPSEKYPLVICNNYLEHQPDTREFLVALRNLLSEDGILYLSVPNLSYLLNKSCYYEFVADHLVYFTKESLLKALIILNFGVLEQYEKNNGNDLVIVAKKRKPLQLSENIEKFNNIVSSVKQLVVREYSEGKKIVIWGAGHRALALMGLACLSEISAIVDSAPFKQGFYTPILGKPIVSPSQLLEMECDLLIVMLPGEYAKQVTSFLEEKMYQCKVVVFRDEPLEFNEV